MKRIFKTVFALVVSFYLVGCGDNAFPDSFEATNTNNIIPPASQIENDFSLTEKMFVHQDLFLQEYFWYEYVPFDVDYDSFLDRDSMVNQLRYGKLDRWSFVVTTQAYDNFTEQKNEGFGIFLTSDYQIKFVLIDSPAWGKLQRGDRIVKINGNNITAERLAQASNQTGVASTFEVLRNDSVIEVTLAPKAYTFKAVDAKILDYQGKSIGYLRYDQFTEASIEELQGAFFRFKRSAIDELVVDLRYNTGGSLGAASLLLDLLHGASPDAVQFTLQGNDRLGNLGAYRFESSDLQEGNELTLGRIVFLTTRYSASASEVVINALKPYVEVVTIGETTHGKPVGMAGRYNPQKTHIYFLINFIVQNAQEQSSPFEGIAPTCQAIDDIDHRLGDPNEAMLKGALYYIRTKTCMPVAQNKQNRSHQKSLHTPFTLPVL